MSDTSRTGHPGLTRPVLALGVGVVTVLSGGVASAGWSAAGTGTASGATTGMTSVAVVALAGGEGPSSTLVPGGTADVVLRASNPNGYPVQVYAVTGNGTVSADGSHPACTTTGVTFTPPPSPIAPTLVIPAESSLLVRLPAAAAMSSAASSGCQGAGFRIPVLLTARR